MPSFRSIVFVSLLLLVSFPAFALQITEAEKEAFKQLSPAEQQQVLQQAGASAPAVAPATESVVPIPVVTPRIAPEPEPEVLQKKQEQRELVEDEPQEKVLPSRELLDRMHQSRDELPRFGYSLFAGAPTTFAPVSDVPVPDGYTIGPGDNIRIQIYGAQNRILSLEVSRDGSIQIPDVGPKPVAGLTFSDMRQDLEETIRRHFIGAQTSITLGKLRSFQVFVLGEAYKPGSYAVSGLATMTHALYVSGGVRETGSLRKIQLRRAGQLVGELDLYDLLLRGDTTSDLRLQSGDTLFIPPRGDSVALAGAVLRPAVYELRTEKNVEDLLVLAGGLLPSAQREDARLLRVEEEHRFFRLNLKEAKDLQTLLRNGDMVQILSLPSQVMDSVVITGHVFQDVVVAWRKGMQVADILPDPSRLPRNMDPYFAVLRTNAGLFRESRMHVFNPDSALKRDAMHNLVLAPGDEITLFDTRKNRSSQLATLVSILRTQARFPAFPEVVAVSGAVRFSGNYPLFSGVSLRRFVENVAMVRSEAELGYVLVHRLGEKPGTIEVVGVDLKSGQDLQLRAGDEAFVFDQVASRSSLVASVVERLRQQAALDAPPEVISIAGQVRFPGSYPLFKGLRLSRFIKDCALLDQDADLNYVQVRRLGKKPGTIEVVGVNLSAEEDIVLRAGDQVFVFDQMSNRAELVSSVVERLRQQAALDAPPEVISAAGQVRFPGSYPLFPGLTLSRFLREGVLLGLDADLSYVQIRRLGEKPGTIDVVGVNLDSGEDLELRPGDQTFVFDRTGNRSELVSSVVERLRQQTALDAPPEVISVAGQVRFPGSYPLFPGLTLSRFLREGVLLDLDADLSYVLVQRRGEKPGTIEVAAVDLEAEEDLSLAPGDSVVVFDHSKDRAELVQPMVQRLRAQASKEKGAQVISIGGRVRFPGVYPYHENLSPADLIRIAGGLLDSALSHSMEVSRREVTARGAETRHQLLDVPQGALDDFLLLAEDHLMIKQIPNWNDVETVTLKGEVLYPGVYPIFKGETMRQVLERAGGVTDFAFIEGTVFLREDLKRLEKERYASYVAQLRSQVAAQSMENREEEPAKNAMVLGLIQQLENTQPVGRLVIDFVDLLVNEKSRDIVLKGGDQLIVPSIVQEVTVMGEVQYPTSHLYMDKDSIFDYIGKSGGLTPKAAERYMYVVKADGSVIPYRPNRFGFRNTEIAPGDTIIVPFDVEAVAPLVFWGDISKILYHMSTSIAALKVIGIF